MFNLKRPCVDCPFRRVGGIRLHPSRAREIATSQIDGQGATFSCHVTVDYDKVDEDDGSYRMTTGRDQYCAGAIAFAHNVGRYNQFLRIMGRLRQFDPANVQDKDQCFASVAEMVKAQKEHA